MLQFSLDEIGEMLRNDSLDSLLIKLESKQKEMVEEIRRLEQTVKSIEQRTARVVMHQELGKPIRTARSRNKS